MSIYTYQINKALSETLDIEFLQIPCLSDQNINDTSDIDENCVYQPLGVSAWIGQKHTRKSKEKISNSLKEYKKTKDHCNAISVAAKSRYSDPKNHPSYGKKGAENPNFGKKYGPHKKTECPYCKKLVALNNIKRYHYENCKWKCS